MEEIFQIFKMITNDQRRSLRRKKYVYDIIQRRICKFKKDSMHRNVANYEAVGKESRDQQKI